MKFTSPIVRSALLSLMLLAFITTLILSGPVLSEVAAGFIPKIPGGSFPLVTAFIASCFSIVAAFYQSYLIQERRRLMPDGALVRDKSFTGIFILGLMTALVMICASAVLHQKGIRVNNATDMAKAIEPLFGKYASTLFLCGLFGASFSASLAIQRWEAPCWVMLWDMGAAFIQKAIRCSSPLSW